MNAETNIEHLSVAIPSQIFELDPMKSWGTYKMMVIRAIFSGLTTIDKEGQIRGDILKSWEINQEGDVYTFYLRKGLLFHDLSEVTANDVAHSISRYFQSKKTEKYNQLLAKYLQPELDTKPPYFLESIEVKSPYTLKVKLKNRSSSFLRVISMSNLKIVKQDQRIIGSGAYVPAFNGDGTITLTRFGHYKNRIIKGPHRITILSNTPKSSSTESRERAKADVQIGLQLREAKIPSGYRKKALGFVGYNHILLNENTVTNYDQRNELAQTLQHYAWSKGATDQFNQKMPHLLPEGLLLPSYYTPRKELETKKRLSLSRSYKVVLVKRHFTKHFLQRLKDHPQIEVIEIQGPEYFDYYSTGRFDAISLPYLGTFFNRADYLPVTFQDKEVADLMDMKSLSTLKSSLNVARLTQAIRLIEKKKLMIPLYSLDIPILFRRSLNIPSPGVRNTLYLGEITKQ